VAKATNLYLYLIIFRTFFHGQPGAHASPSRLENWTAACLWQIDLVFSCIRMHVWMSANGRGRRVGA
jgi:hypothetical protein